MITQEEFKSLKIGDFIRVTPVFQSHWGIWLRVHKIETEVLGYKELIHATVIEPDLSWGIGARGGFDLTQIDEIRPYGFNNEEELLTALETNPDDPWAIDPIFQTGKKAYKITDMQVEGYIVYLRRFMRGTIVWEWDDEQDWWF